MIMKGGNKNIGEKIMQQEIMNMINNSDNLNIKIQITNTINALRLQVNLYMSSLILEMS